MPRKKSKAKDVDLCPLEKQLQEFTHQMKDANREIREFNHSKMQFLIFSRKTIKEIDTKITQLSQKIFEAQKVAGILDKIRATNENVEEALCNVLLAIRQNEYLQGWYPEQHGFPDMKVTGVHPAKLTKVVHGSKR